jgi:alkyl hydroperoxide reductase subunit AhpC
VGISSDSPYCHIAWQRHEIDWLDYPLVSDFYPHGAVAESYGVRRENPVPLAGISERAVFVVDKSGLIVFSRVYELSEVPPNEDVFQALQRVNAQTARR